ncbi:MAG: hypothetical protein DI635_14125 [Pseudoxanthomonas suwonensis]|nr:MAG: hypothetical protein DI635_14125 [Pseudoxanthomonas suwonensis]
MTSANPVEDPAPRTVAIIGGGPRGISVLERLLANAPQLEVTRLRVVVIEPYRAGGGRVWDPDQPAHLLMNTLCADATHFTDDTVDIHGPIRPGPTLYEWGLQVRDGQVADLGSPDRPVREEIRSEAQWMEPHSHPSRAFLGSYLEWCLAQDVADAPEGIEVEVLRGTALAVRSVVHGWEIEVAATVPPTDPGHDPGAGCTTVQADAVVLATGHSDTEPSRGESELASTARQHGLYYGTSTNPISQHGLSTLAPGEPVIVRGLGMNFFDYMSLLTEGRGGRFRDVDGGAGGSDALVYEPSGEEPVLLAGSGRGVPYRAKGRFGQMTPTFPKRYFTPELMRSLHHQAQHGPPIDFREQMLPAIMKDGALTYYTVLSREQPDALAGDLAQVTEALDELTWGEPELDEVLARLVPDPAHRLDVARLDRPLDGIELSDSDQLVQWWLEDLRRDLVEANKGMDSALKCASVQIGAGRAPLRTLVRYGGLRGTSYARDVEGWFRGFGGMLASGPPARRIEELVALVKAGIVRPVGARMQVASDGEAFTVSSPTVPGVVSRARAVLEAHLPAANLSRTANPVLAALEREGLGRPFVIPDDRDQAFTSGALEVGQAPYRVVSAQGEEQRGLYAVGVPLESILWGTQLQPLARTNSRMLREIDAVARDALRPGIDVESEGRIEARDPDPSHRASPDDGRESGGGTAHQHGAELRAAEPENSEPEDSEETA